MLIGLAVLARMPDSPVSVMELSTKVFLIIKAWLFHIPENLEMSSPKTDEMVLQ